MQKNKLQGIPDGQKMDFAKDISAFLKADRKNPPAKNQILFYGSSIIRLWTHLGEQFAPLPVLNRGFGGARTWEAFHYADNIVLPYAPKIIVYYTGSNDINTGEPPQAIFDRYRQFSEKVAKWFPDTKIYYLAIFRAPQKQDKWNIVDETNRLARVYSAQTPNRVFVDANFLVFDTHGQARRERYVEDGLHFKDETYTDLAAFLKPVLQNAWEQTSNHL